MKRLTPHRLIFLSFATAIVVGTIALRVEGSLSAMPLAWTDALFTATSATCVTGLVVKDTGSDFSLGGQLIILALIQLGGLGILTLSSWFLLLLGRRPSLSGQTALTESFGLPAHLTLRRLLMRAIVYTLAVETVGAVLLFARFVAIYSPKRAAYLAVFHSISAFCNAGFGLFSNSLEDFANDPWINAVFIALIALGGLGFYVLEEIRAAAVSRWRGRPWRWSLHTRVVLATSVALIAVGAAAIFILESLGTHVATAWHARLMPALFQSVTARTAGFNTVDIDQLTNGTISILLLLMFIGASPGSTGGGIKTTTFAILGALVVARWRGRSDAEIAGRRIPADLVAKALAVTIAFLVGILLCVLILQVTELGGRPHSEVRGEFLELLFETVSAFGTVGLSLGVTPTLSTAGKLVIVLAMLVGRLGPLSFALTLIGERRRLAYRFPEERILIG